MPSPQQLAGLNAGYVGALLEQYLENLEKGQPDDWRPVVVPVSFGARE